MVEIVDIVAPLRSEALFDITRLPDGSFKADTTIRFATFLDDIAGNLNETVVLVEGISDFFSEIQQAQSFTAELSKRDNELDQLSSLLGNSNARIAELQKQVNELNELIDDPNKADFAFLRSQINELQELVE